MMAQINNLSKRERDVVALLLQGKSNKQIALALGITESTVEFHLKNVYAKLQVSSRAEAILKLGRSIGLTDEHLRESVVDDVDKKKDNGGELILRKRWIWLLYDMVSIIKKEIAMKNLLDTKHVSVGVLTALFTGLLWVAWFIYDGHPLEWFRPWIVAGIVILVAIGVSVGLVGKRSGNTLRRVFFSALFGAAVALIAARWMSLSSGIETFRASEKALCEKWLSALMPTTTAPRSRIFGATASRPPSSGVQMLPQS